MEPTTILTASAIAQLAFGSFVKAGAGEITKKALDSTANLIKKLQTHIAEKLKARPKAQAALAEVMENGKPEALERVSRYLDVEMLEDEAFSTIIKEVSRQIINCQSEIHLGQSNNNFGRDQNVINQPQGDIRIGGS